MLRQKPGAIEMKATYENLGSENLGSHLNIQQLNRAREHEMSNVQM
jgi:hypothetical protein